MSQPPLSLAGDFAPATDANWRSLVEKSLGQQDFERSMIHTTAGGLDLNSLYSFENAEISAGPTKAQAGWDIRQAIWHSDAATVNHNILSDLEGGATSVLLHIQAGSYPGVALSALGQALKGVHLHMAAIHMVPGEEFDDASTAMLKHLDNSDTDPEMVHCILGVDPLGTLAQTGRLLSSLPIALERATEIALLAQRNKANIQTFSVNTHPYHAAGANPVQELALMLATGLVYLRAMEKAGMSISDAAGQISFTLAADADLYMTVAKFRAARRLWALVLHSCGVKSVDMTLNAVTGAQMYSRRDPWVNILRGTTACFAAVVGGAGAVTVLPFDSSIGIPSDFGRRIARNSQIILSEESNLGRVIDPAAGSFAFESITSDLCDRTWALFQKYEASEGGFNASLLSGSVKAEMDAAWAVRRAGLATRKEPLTGVSEYPDIHETLIAGQSWTKAEVIKPAGEEIEALECYHRLAEDFEVLRDCSDKIEAASGSRPSIFLACIGGAADFTARASFARHFFHAGGIEAIMSEANLSAEELAKAYLASGARLAILCSSDELYERDGAKVVTAIGDAGPSRLFIAGRPKNLEELVISGADEIIQMGSDVIEVITRVYDLLEDGQ